MKNKIVLPKIFDKETWEKMGSKPEWEQHIGKPRISYSQINTWTNTSYEKYPKYAYITENFLGVPKNIPEAFGEFGGVVEDYICYRKNDFGLKTSETKTLDKIKPLGTFQVPILLEFEGFVLIGYIDDRNDKILRDYKTASNSSKEQYLNGDYKQLHIYALDDLLNKGKLVSKLEVVIIERLGNAFNGGGLSVGNEIWKKEFKPTKEELLEMRDKVQSITEEISEYYKVFLKMT